MGRELTFRTVPLEMSCPPLGCLCVWSRASAAPRACVQYHRYIEIAIKQCRSSGIDCKIHGLVLLGRIRAEEEDLAAVPFLASETEEEDEERGGGGR